MRQVNGGTLTPKDKAVVNQQQNRLSKDIYAQKHDAQTQGSGTGEIAQRKENQQDRIAQGVASGELTARETARLEGKESALNQETRDMRSLDGGKLTSGRQDGRQPAAEPALEGHLRPEARRADAAAATSVKTDAGSGTRGAPNRAPLFVLPHD